MVLCTYSRSGVKKGLVDGDLGPDAMVQLFVLLHENFTTAKKIDRQANFRASYLAFYCFNFYVKKCPAFYVISGLSFYGSIIGEKAWIKR